MRPVIDVSALNCFVENAYFQMEHLSTIKSLLKQGHFMTKPERCLPFSCHSSPIPKMSALLLEKQALPVQVTSFRIYLDDMLIIVSTFQETQHSQQFTLITDEPAEVPGLCFKHRRNQYSPLYSGSHLSGFHNQLNLHDYELTARKDEQAPDCATNYGRVRKLNRRTIRMILVGLAGSPTLSSFTSSLNPRSQPDTAQLRNRGQLNSSCLHQSQRGDTLIRARRSDTPENSLVDQELVQGIFI